MRGAVTQFTMTQKITITYINSNGDEVSENLPSKNEVCERCEGHGTHLNPSIGNHAYTAEEFQDSFDDEQQEQYFRRGGIYDVKCEECGGRNVVQVVDREATMTEEQKAHLVAYDAHMEEEERYRIQAQAERRWEMGAMGGYSDYY